MSEPDLVSASEGASYHPGWQGILEPGERILWQGEPDSRFRLEFKSLGGTFPALFFVCFSLFWMYQAAQGSIFFAMFGLFFLVIGLRDLLTPIFGPSFLRSRTWYTLTDRRAIVATDVPMRGRKLSSFPIDRDTPVEYVDGNPPSIYFGHSAVDRSQRGGFQYIADADKVMAMIRDIQRTPTVDRADP
ncbi:aspartate carbamoyltransferase catalytic subunit [Paracoccus albus]|uniref:aspartate carbamoyltransferase catalytic subunit n=1 Tax=Paracoccus albus TaxID=3017784 RepID=UPI0022F00427|nr:aspartate carbamoyltransferase catalytic subunit [Paracoccus albus]WBU60512.1 aspartate carbamoyltransferase catalytic subunit [Paracoccus albus]